MKFKLPFVFLALAFAALGQQPGTTRVNAPIAPPAKGSNFPAVFSENVGGGFNTSFDNVGDWDDPAKLPAGKMELNMRVSAKNDTQRRVYRLINLSPRTFELDVDATRQAVITGAAVTVDTEKLTGDRLLISTSGGDIGVSPTTVNQFNALVNDVSFSPLAYGAVGDGVADDTAAVQACFNAAAAAKRPVDGKGRIYGVGLNINAPAGLYYNGGGGGFRALVFPAGSGSVNSTMIEGNDSVTFKNVTFDLNRAVLGAQRVPANLDGTPSGGSDYTFTRLFHGFRAVGKIGVYLENVNFTNTFNPPLLLHQCTFPTVRNSTFFDVNGGPQIINCTKAFVDRISVRDSFLNMARVDPSAVQLLFNFDSDFRFVEVQNVGGGSAAGTSFLSGINCWGSVNCRFYNLVSSGIHPSNTLTKRIGILFDGLYNCRVDGIFVSKGWENPSFEVMAPVNTTIENGIIDCTGYTSGTPYGMVVKNEGNFKGPGPGFPNFRTTLQRSRSQGANSTIRNIRVINAYTSFFLNSPQMTYEGLQSYGAKYAGIQVDDDDGNSGAAGLFRQRIPIDLGGVTLKDCIVRGSEYFGMMIFGGKNLEVVGGRFSDNGQAKPTLAAGIVGQSRWVVTPSAGGPYVNNVPVGSSVEALSVDNKLGWRRADIFTSGGVFVETARLLPSSTTTTLVFENDLGAGIDTTKRVHIYPWDQGNVRIIGVNANDTQDWTETATVSFDPITCPTLQRMTNLTFTRGTQRLFPNQRLMLNGIASGGVSPNLMVRVVGWTEPFADQVEVQPIGLGTSGAAIGAATLVVPLASVPGTWTSTATGTRAGDFNAGNRGVLTAVSGATTDSFEGFFYVIPGTSFTPGTTDATRLYEFKSGTVVEMMRNFSPAITASAVSKVAIATVDSIPSQKYGIALDRWNGSTKIIGAQTLGNTVSGTLTTTAPNTTIVTW